jgi:hypothetical protein
MARDIAGLLTGISSRQQPVQQAVPGSPDFYGKFMAARGQGLQQGLGRLARGGAPSRQEQIEGSMFQLSNPTTAAGEAKDTATRIADLTKLAQVQQMRGNPTGAMQSLAQVQQLKEQALKSEQFNQLALKVQTINPDLAAQIANQVPGSLEAGLKALEPKGEVVNIVRGSDRRVISTAIQKPDGSLVSQSTGKTITLSPGLGVSKTIPGAGINLAPDPSAEVIAETLKKNLQDQRLMFETVEAKMPEARQKLETAQRIYTSLEKEAPSGSIAEIAAKWASDVQGIYALAGKTAPEAILKRVNDAGALKQIAFEALQPLIDAQGKGFTDKDREAAKLVMPGISQPWQYNEMVADLDTLDAYKTQDQMLFANKRKKLTEVTKQAGETLWTYYLNDLPMSKVEKVKKRGLDYKRLVPIKTNEDLSQYWVRERPVGFKIKNGSEVVEMSFKDIRETAASKDIELSPREYLADLSRQCLLIDGVYE